MGVGEDISFASAVSAGDGNACEVFVSEYTDLVLSKVRALMRTH